MFGLVGMRKVDNTCTNMSTGGGGTAPTDSVQDFDLVNFKASATSIDWQAVAHFPWSSVEQASITGGSVVYYFSYVDRTMDIRVRDVTNGATLGFQNVVTSSGLKTLSIVSVPPGDANIEIQIKKNAVSGISPVIMGMTMYLV